MKKTGSKTWIFIDSFDESKVILGATTAQTAAKTKYFVLEKGENSNIPVNTGSFFQSPLEANNQIQLALGDKLFPLQGDRFCKTAASFTAAEGLVDVTDDCDNGYASNILDGYVALTGTFAGFQRYDDTTAEFSDVTSEILNKFFTTVEDDGARTYTIKPKSSTKLFMLTLLNSDVKTGQYENWLFCPIVLNSLTGSWGLKDAQNQDIAWAKGEGEAVIYKVPKAV